MSDDERADESQDDATSMDQLRSIVVGVSTRDALTALALLVLLFGLTGVVYVALTPQQGTTPYTEFYILGSEGLASDYPTNLTVDERATVTVGIINHEQRPMTYTLVHRTENRTLGSRTVTVARDQRWEGSVSYSLGRPGVVRVRFLLYRGSSGTDGAEPYRQLRLWTNVSDGRATTERLATE